MEAIGGYFGLEIPLSNHDFLHSGKLAFKSGRSSLYFICQLVKPKKVYVPFYTCDALLEPLHLLNVEYEFYALTPDLEISKVPELKRDEYLIYINYFDAKRTYVSLLADKIGSRLIVDNSQAYFYEGLPNCWSFNSSRKFFGVPDGSFLSIPAGIDIGDAYQSIGENEHYLMDHLILRFNGRAEEGYRFFQENERLNGGTVQRMSRLTKELLSSIDYTGIAEKRRVNYFLLANALKPANSIDIGLMPESVPFCFPFLPKKLIDKKVFWEKKIYLPQLWSDCISRSNEGFEWERSLSQRLLPLPVDHRIRTTDCEEMIRLIEEII